MRSTLWATEVQCTAAVRMQELGRGWWQVAGVGMIIVGGDDRHRSPLSWEVRG